MMHMRLGNEPRAKELLAASFEADPFNVRVSNSLKVLEVLDGYATLETEHFILRYDAEKDAVLARHAARHAQPERAALSRCAVDFQSAAKKSHPLAEVQQAQPAVVASTKAQAPRIETVTVIRHGNGQ